MSSLQHLHPHLCPTWTHNELRFSGAPVQIAHAHIMVCAFLTAGTNAAMLACYCRAQHGPCPFICAALSSAL